MQALQIKIIIQPGKPLEVNVLNSQGSACQQLTQPLEKLGSIETTHKPEYHQEPSIHTATDIQVDGHFGGDW